MVFKIAQKVTNHLDYFCVKFVAKKFQKSPNLVTLVTIDSSDTTFRIIPKTCFYKKCANPGLFCLFSFFTHDSIQI